MHFECLRLFQRRIMYARSVGDNNCAIVVTDTFLARLPESFSPAVCQLNLPFLASSLGKWLRGSARCKVIRVKSAKIHLEI